MTAAIWKGVALVVGFLAGLLGMIIARKKNKEDAPNEEGESE